MIFASNIKYFDVSHIKFAGLAKHSHSYLVILSSNKSSIDHFPVASFGPHCISRAYDDRKLHIPTDDFFNIHPISNSSDEDKVELASAKPSLFKKSPSIDS